MNNDRPTNDPQAPGALVPGPDSHAIEAVTRAAADIRASRSLLTSLVSQIEAMVMRNCWIIRNAFAERDDFRAFMARELGDILNADQAWDMAETWKVVKRNRQVAELAAVRPREAVELIHMFTRAIGGGRQPLDAAADEHEQEFNELAAMPRAKRRKELQRMAAERQAAREGRNPDDVARIKHLEDEQAALKEAAAEKPTSRARQCRDALDELRKRTHAVAEAVLKVNELGCAENYPAHLVKSLTLQYDMLFGQAEALGEAIARDGERRAREQGIIP